MTSNNNSNNSSNSADFAPLGDIEFDSTRALFDWCDDGRKRASNAGLILIQAAQDLFLALQTVPSMDRNMASVRRRARRVARHAKRAADHMRAAQQSFAKIPSVFMAEYGEELAQQRRSQVRKPFNLRDR